MTKIRLNEEKVTKAMIFEALREFVATNDVCETKVGEHLILERLDKEIATANAKKANASNKPKKVDPAKEQANADMRAAILEALAGLGDGSATAKEIGEECGFSTSMAATRLKELVAEGKVDKITVGKSSTYRII